MWQKAKVLAVDEPTNHLDIEAQDVLFEALSTFRGVGILVSHDRKLLDDLCRQCLFIDPPEAILRPGNYSHGLMQAEKDEINIKKQFTNAKHNYLSLRREASKRKVVALKANRKRSKKGLKLKDHDSREKIDLARATGNDGYAGKKFRQLEGRLPQARKKMDSIKVKKTYYYG